MYHLHRNLYFHKLEVTVSKTLFKKQRPKIINYRNPKNFVYDKLKKKSLKFDTTNVRLSKLNDSALSALEKHAPKKKRNKERKEERNIYGQAIVAL